MTKRRALIVGAGGMGRAWGVTLRDDDAVEVVGWVDLHPEAAVAAVADLALDDVHSGDDLGQAIREARPDFVVDASIPQTHRDVTLQALHAGLPVLGEKPMSTSMTHAREMVAAAEDTGLLFMVSQNRSYNAKLAALRRLIQDDIGPLGILNSDFYRYIAPQLSGFRAELGSLLLLDMAIHTFDAARYLSGADPVAVYCEEFNPPWSRHVGFVCATALFEMTGGLRYTYRGSWSSEGCETSYEGAWRAVGPHGGATWDGESVPVAELVTERGRAALRRDKRVGMIEEDTREGISGSLRDFLHALDTGSTPMGECHDNIKSLAMVFGAVESARTGRRVTIAL